MTNTYIDIHSHLLFGVDDGSKSIDESLKMLEIARTEGIQTMFATPHYGQENGYAPEVQLIREHFHTLKERAVNEFPDMQLLLGCELYCAPGKVLQLVEQNKALSMNDTKYLLLEFLEWGDTHEEAEHICQSMLDIAKTDWIPILAHAERYRTFQGKQHLYREMVDAGVYLQINAYDLVDHADDWVKENARWIVDQRLAHFMGTDAHGTAKRPPVMRSGAQYIHDHCPQAYADALLGGNAQRMISGVRLES